MQISKFARRFTALLALAATLLPAHAADTYKWSVQYIVDNSQVVFGQSQKVWPRRCRGIALSPDGKSLYTSFHRGANGGGEVRKLAVGITDDYGRATQRVLAGPMAKGLATDDKGRVYISGDSEVLIYDAELSRLISSVGTGVTDGLATAREGKELVLYTSDRQASSLKRFVLAETGEDVTGATQAGFDGSGEVLVKGALSLRGVDVDAKGNIWVADHDGGKVFRVSKDGKNIEAAEVKEAMDISVDGNRAFVTRGAARAVAVLESDSMKVLGNLAVPWEELELSPYGNNGTGRLAGIVAVPGKGFLVTNEGGQTAGQKSTYGKVDGNTDTVGGKAYRDAYLDDNEPILRALGVE